MTRPPGLPNGERPAVSPRLLALITGVVYGAVLASIIWGVFLCACAS